MWIMKKTLKGAAFGLFLCAFVLSGMNVYATDITGTGEWLGEKPDWAPDFSASIDFATKYIWRGWNLGDEPVMQTDMSVSKWGFTFDFWTNYTLNDDKTRDGGRYQEFTEVDYTIDYSTSVGELAEIFNFDAPDILDPLGFSTGYIYYTFPNVDWGSKYFDSHEVYWGVSYDTLLQPSFTWYKDFGSGQGGGSGGNGNYFLWGIGHTFEFPADVTLDLGITASYIDGQWTDKSGWGDMVFSGGVNIPLFTYFSISPYFAYSFILDRDTYGKASENEFYGGISIGFSY